ncbi:MAG: nucleotide exchange factor GrpE [Candidatus Dojkabacteria bacterium]
MKSEKIKKEKCECQECDCESLELKVSELALTIDKVEDEKLNIQNQLKKALADYHNLVNNSEKRETLRFFQMKKNLCQQIIPTLDAMMMAVASSKDMSLDEKSKSWLEGILATIESIYKNFSEIGLKQYIPNVGDVFNNQRHEAVATIESEKKGEIVEIVQPGYTLDDTVIRPSRVVVSK